MAVYKRGYQRYQGTLTGHWTRLLAMPRFAWKRLFEQRLVVLLTVVSLVWPLLCAFFIYLSNHAELWAGMGREFREFIAIEPSFFMTFMSVQAVFVIFLAAMAGPGLIAPDLANNALPLYLSRPLSRPDYVMAKMVVLLGVLSLVTWVPGLLLFGMQVSMAGRGWFTANWNVGLAMVIGFLLWIVLVSLVALASSAYVKWSRLASGVVLAFFFVLSGVGQTVNGVFRVTWGSLLDPFRSVSRIWAALLDVESKTGLGLAESVVVAAVFCGLLLLVLERKLRPVEVIR
jgi:ABC-2 type transport system permease protein